MHPMWGALFSPATRPCYGKPLSYSGHRPPTLFRARCNLFSLLQPQPHHIEMASCAPFRVSLTVQQLDLAYGKKALQFRSLASPDSDGIHVAQRWGALFSPATSFSATDKKGHPGVPSSVGFSRRPSTHGIMHPMWGELFSPATRPCYGFKKGHP